MTRAAVLRSGYGLLAVAFVALGASATPAGGALVLPSFFLAFVAAWFLVFSDDDIPRWGGLVILAFVVLTLVVFVLANPISFSHNGHYYIEPVSPTLAQALYDTLIQLSPVIIAGAALAASWERETPVRILLVGGAIGLLVVEVVTLLPTSGQAQATLLLALFAVSALACAIGEGWSAARPEEYA
jgi:hypothetical protein